MNKRENPFFLAIAWCNTLRSPKLQQGEKEGKQVVPCDRKGSFLAIARKVSGRKFSVSLSGSNSFGKNI
jgi:hypothetical protein